MQYHDLEILKMMHETEFDCDLDTEASVGEHRVPRKYRVMLLRDDFTPTDFIPFRPPHTR